ncbi:MAG: hypothetical protein KGL39_15120 [Patescibacteria group bacterium]|nr:hypothetical protein [Patescibacteria group bacterium]
MARASSGVEGGYPFNQRVGPAAVLAQTFDGTPGGMNLALPAHEIDDSQARVLLDWIVDQPGITRQRGPVQGVSNLPLLPRLASGVFATLNPQGITKYATLTGNASNGYFTVLSDDQSAWIDLAWPFALPTSPGTAGQSYQLVDAKPALGGGLLVGTSSDYGAAGVNQGIAYWFGGTKANWTGTVSCTRGSQSVTGSGFSANVVPGMFLFANTDDLYTNAYLGIVLSVNSDTSITLLKRSPHTATSKSGTFQSIRGLAPRVTTGEITTDTSSTTVTGGETKFLSQGLNNGTWQLYRQSDGAFIGKVSTVNSEISLTLAANAAVAMADDSYVAIRVDADFSIQDTVNTQKVGFLNATYADRQWYANRGSSFDTTSQVWFSDAADLEGLDLSSYDGNWLEITSSSSVNEPIRGIAAAYNGLLVFKETETFIVGGNSPSSFDVRKLEDDGTLHGMSVQEFGGGVIWAGREGINFYDGVQVVNLVAATLGQVWKDTIRTLDPTTYRLWSMVNHDHYFLFLENAQPTFSIIKGNASNTPTRFTVVINMVTRAVTLATNLDLRGSTVLPATAGKQAWYLVNAGLPAVGTVTATPATTGGTLAAGTYYYKVTAIDSNGKQTAASAEVSAATTGTTGEVVLSWPAVGGAASYCIYKGTAAGAENGYFTSTTASYTDTGTATTAGTPPSADSTQYGIVCDGEKLFNTTGIDPIVCLGNSGPGPSIYIESKKFDAGDGMRLKRWKLVAMNYLAQGGSLVLDIVLGLNEVGQTASTTFPESVPTWTSVRANITSWTNMKAQYATWKQVVQSVFIPARIRMQKKSQFLSFRLYGSVKNLTNAQIGPYEVAYKLQRVGRV